MAPSAAVARGGATSSGRWPWAAQEAPSSRDSPGARRLVCEEYSLPHAVLLEFLVVRLRAVDRHVRWANRAVAVDRQRLYGMAR